MKRCSSRQAFALLLGVLLALGMSLSAAQAADMAARMAPMASDMSISGQGGCDGCGGGAGDDGAAALSNCLFICAASAFAVLAPAVLVAAGPTLHPSQRPYLVSAGWASSPEPYPPRPTDFV